MAKAHECSDASRKVLGVARIGASSAVCVIVQLQPDVVAATVVVVGVVLSVNWTPLVFDSACEISGLAHGVKMLLKLLFFVSIFAAIRCQFGISALFSYLLPIDLLPLFCVCLFSHAFDFMFSYSSNSLDNVVMIMTHFVQVNRYF